MVRDGITARQLLEHRGNRVWLSPAQLETWLLDNGFAERVPDRRHEHAPETARVTKLVPTAAGRFAGAGLELLG